MTGPEQAVRPPRRFFRRLRMAGICLAVFFAIVGIVLLWLYYNLATVVVWFANRANPAFSLKLDSAGFANGRRIEFHNLSLKLSNADGQVLEVEKAVVDFHWRNLWHRHIDGISLENPRVAVSDRVLDLAGGKSEEKKTELVSPDGLWLVDEFKITGGKADIDLLQSPSIRFAFTSNLKGVYLSPETKFSTQVQTLEIRDVEVAGHGSKPERFGAIKSIAVRFSLDRLAQNKVDELSIQAPSFSFTPSCAASLEGMSSDTSSGRVGRVSTPWTIGKLHLTDGEFFMKDFGSSNPETSLKFALDEENVLLGSSAGAPDELAHKIQLWDIRVAAPFARLEPFFWIGSAQLDFTSAGLFARRELGVVTITGMDFSIGQKFRSLLAADVPSSQPTVVAASAPVNANQWKIRNLRIINGRATLADLGVELPDIGFKLDTDLKDLPLSASILRSNNDMQEVVFSDLTIHSPHDPFVPVLNFALIRLRFTLAQLLDQSIDEVIFERPTIFVGEQLFWYADELKRRAAAVAPVATQPAAAPAPGWSINKVIVKEGGLVVANGGHAGLPVPFQFMTEVENINFNDLGNLRVKMKLVIPKDDYAFPSYQLKFKQLEGGIEFGLPPDTNAKNIVQDFKATRAGWKQFAAEKLWLSVTYDVNGIYGKFGGAAYHGYVTGEFDFYMQPDTPWAGWVSGSDLDLKSVTDILAPQNFQMNGPANINVEVNGLNHTIERFTGNMRTKKAGKLKIGKLDRIIAAIPDTWSSLKQGSTRITLETLRDFDYTTGNGEFWYAGDKGHLALKMQGPHGSRNFDIAVHGD